MHERGGYGSVGYGYNWKRSESQKNLLRTHTTAVSSRMLYQLAQAGFRPAKYFSIDRVFRNEAVDRTHLAEFHQVEGARRLGRGAGSGAWGLGAAAWAAGWLGAARGGWGCWRCRGGASACAARRSGACAARHARASPPGAAAPAARRPRRPTPPHPHPPRAQAWCATAA